MNYKLEKFWNEVTEIYINGDIEMNYKLEKFWNTKLGLATTDRLKYEL